MMKKLFLFFKALLTSLLLSACCELNTDNIVYIVSTNDMHANVLNHNKQIDLALISGLKKHYDALLFDAGDAVQGAPLAALSDGDDVISLMNAAGYDAMTLGNHEFDYGQNKLFEHAASANFLTLCSNVYKDKNNNDRQSQATE